METTNHECYISLEVAKLLKKAGFDWHTNLVYVDDKLLTNPYTADWNNTIPDTYTSAPTLEIAQKWLREVKGLHICVKADAASINCKYFVTVIISDTKWGNVQDENKKTILFNTYEEAQEAGIKKCLTILLEDKK